MKMPKKYQATYHYFYDGISTNKRLIELIQKAQLNIVKQLEGKDTNGIKVISVKIKGNEVIIDGETSCDFNLSPE